MTSVSFDDAYSYLFASEVRTDEEKPLVLLSTYDGKGTPNFFHSGIAEPAVFAETLICTSAIIRSHFFEHGCAVVGG